MPPQHQRRTGLDGGSSRHAKLPQAPQISAGLALPTEELLSQHQPHWNCQRVRLSNDSIEQNPYDTLPCKSGNKAYLAHFTTNSSQRNERNRAVVAVARKLAVLLHRLWVSGEAYEPLRNSQKAMSAAA